MRKGVKNPTKTDKNRQNIPDVCLLKSLPKGLYFSTFEDFLREVYKKVFSELQMKNFMKTFALQLEKHTRLLYYV